MAIFNNKSDFLSRLEPSCCKKRQKKSPGQETGLGNRELLNDTKLLLNDLGPIFYNSEPSDVPYLPNHFLALEFFAASYSNIALGSYYLI